MLDIFEKLADKVARKEIAPICRVCHNFLVESLEEFLEIRFGIRGEKGLVDGLIIE